MNLSRKKKSKNQNTVGTIVTYILTGASWVSVIALWCCAASAYVNPATFRLAGVIGLMFPIFLTGTCLTGLLCLLFAPRRSWICAVGMLLAAGSIRSYCPWNPAFLKTAEEGDLKIMNYNCHYFSACTEEEDKKALLEYLQDIDADILCIQEGNAYFESWWELVPDFDKLYPYHSFPYTTETMVQGCYSRYPILRSEMISKHTQNAIIAFWIEHPSPTDSTCIDSILIVNCHLQSNHLSPEDREKYQGIVQGKNDEVLPSLRQQYEQRDSTYVLSRRIASHIATSAGVRAAMVDTLTTFLDRHRDIPTVVCGDFNDTSISYSIQRLKSYGMNDAFRMTGNGPGISFHNNGIAVRIDHQFCNDRLTPVSANIDDDAYFSDHKPLIVNYKSSIIK